MPRVSQRGINIPSSPIRKLAPFADLAKSEGKHVFHLNIGQPDIKTPKLALDAVHEDKSTIIQYGPAEGMLSLRNTFCDYYTKFGGTLSPQDIFVTTGASEAIVFALSACCDPGDEVIIPEPFYANYIGFTNFCAAKVVPISSYLDTAFSLPSVDQFKTKLTDRTKAIVLCNPGNPTGKVYPRKDLEAIVDFVIQNDLFLIVDEVYKEFCYDLDFYSVLQFENAKDHVIVIDSVSKIFSLCGARVGFLATANKAIQASVLKFAQMRLCPPYHGQLLAETAFKNAYPYLTEVKTEYLIRRNTLFEELQKIEDIKIYLPEGAFYIIAQLPAEDADDFCQWMLSDFSYNNKTVMLSPASGFYFNTALGKSQIRIAFILNSQDIREAIECLRKGLEVYKIARLAKTKRTA
jgi:aspartate aminotransferase